MCCSDDKARFCCGIDIKVGGCVVAVLSIAGSAGILLAMICCCWGIIAISIGAVNCTCHIIPGVLFFIGISRKRSLFILPFFIVTGIDVLLNFIFILLFIIMRVVTYVTRNKFLKFMNDKDFQYDSDATYYALTSAAFLPFTALFFCITWAVYLHIKAQGSNNLKNCPAT